MPKVRFLSEPEGRSFHDGKCVEYDPGSLNYRGEGLRGSLLDVALNHDIDLMHLCGGICACITCHVIIEDGDQNLNPPNKDEEDRLYRVAGYTLHSRLACRAVVLGDVTVRIPERSRAE